MDGPSTEKIGAAITAWTNRIKPIQLLEGSDDEKVIFINFFIALNAGMNIKWDLLGKHQIFDEIALKNIYPVIMV